MPVTLITMSVGNIVRHAVPVETFDARFPRRAIEYSPNADRSLINIMCSKYRVESY